MGPGSGKDRKVGGGRKTETRETTTEEKESREKTKKTGKSTTQRQQESRSNITIVNCNYSRSSSSPSYIPFVLESVNNSAPTAVLLRV